MPGRKLIVAALVFGMASTVHAGMTVYDLNDVVRLRLEDISFFAVLLIVCALGIMVIWNHVAKGFSKLPRITFVRSLCLMGILSLLMLLVLSMISGARELLTPGAWRRQGSAYRLNDAASEPMRRQCMEFLRGALRAYAEQHSRKYPAHDFVPEISEKIWQAPDNSGARYIYIGGLTQDSEGEIVACEPVSFGDQRFVLLANGEIKKLSTTALHNALGIKEAH